MIMNGEEVRIWKELIVAHFSILSPETGETEENSKKPQDRR
jgi:hypothetical protein